MNSNIISIGDREIGYPQSHRSRVRFNDFARGFCAMVPNDLGQKVRCKLEFYPLRVQAS